MGKLYLSPILIHISRQRVKYLTMLGSLETWTRLTRVGSHGGHVHRICKGKPFPRYACDRYKNVLTSEVGIYCQRLLHPVRAHNKDRNSPSAGTHLRCPPASGCIHPALHWRHGSSPVADPMSQDRHMSSSIRLLGAVVPAGSIERKVHRPGQVVQSRYSGINGDGYCNPFDTITNGVLSERFDLEEGQNVPHIDHRGGGSRNNNIQRSCSI